MSKMGNYVVGAEEDGTIVFNEQNELLRGMKLITLMQVGISEGFEYLVKTEDTVIKAWQHLVDTGLAMDATRVGLVDN